MKSFIIVIAVLFSQNQVCLSQNLIPNGDFEDGPEHSSYGWENQLDGCTVSGSMDGPDQWYIVNNTPDRLVNGDYACDFSSIKAQSGLAYVDFVYMEAGKTVLLEPLQEGESYTLTFWARWQTFQGAAEEPSGIQFIFSSGGNVIDPSPIENKDEWKMYEYNFISQSNSEELQIIGTIDKFGGVCIDNITLEKQNAENLPPENRADLWRYMNKN